ncbi:MAG: colicin E3/pyocin S6 family cytotoxin [Alphaproteobacteria bacterium]|nr:colicin E3/pyocin S6 family cytotoxin [Alphaproteobacteria bacterium]
MVWSQPAAREMMEHQMGYPFGRPDLAPSAVIQLESPLPTRAPQACGGMDIPVPGKPDPMITPMPAPRIPEPLVTPMPEQRRPEPMITPMYDAPAGLTEGFDIHRSSIDDLIKYRKGDGRYEQPKAHPAPKDGLPAFPEAREAKKKTPRQGGSGLRERWKDREYIYEWDARHGRVEKYTARGKHLGEFDHITGAKTKEADPTRRIES